MKYDIDGHLWWAPTKKPGRGWIVHKDSGSAPTPPDPYQTANAQTQANINTARYNAGLNRVNQVTPWGSMTYTHTPAPGSTSAPAAPTFDQAGYDKAMAQWQAGQSVSGQGMGAEAGGGGGGYTGPMPTRDQFMSGGAAGAGGPGAEPDQWNANIALSPEQQRLLDLQNATSTMTGQIRSNLLGATTDLLSNPMNFNGAPAQVTNVGSGQLTYGVNGGPLRSSAGYGSIRNDVDMSNVPGLVGGDALAGAMNQAQRAAYNQQTAYLDPQWQNSQHDLENQLTQQGVMRNSDAWNRAMDDQSRNRTFAYNQAAQSAIGLGNAAEQQLFSQGLASNQNAYSQALNNAQFHNQAQGQGFGQDYQNALLQNAAQAQQFGQGVQNAQLNNSAQGQAFSQGMQNAQLQNQGRQQSIAETQALRAQPLNELAALQNGSQVTAPNFPSVPGANMQGTDIAGLIAQNYANQMGGYNAQVAQGNAITNGLFGLGAAYLMA